MTTQTLDIKTNSRSAMVEITHQVNQLVNASGITDGQVTIYIPHTTAGVTINENADPDVVHDFLRQLDLMVPWEQPFYKHMEGNSAAHIKASMMGFSATVLIERGRMLLGQWQGIYFCEFDGPRNRRVLVRISK